MYFVLNPNEFDQEDLEFQRFHTEEDLLEYLRENTSNVTDRLERELSDIVIIQGVELIPSLVEIQFVKSFNLREKKDQE